ncbi:MAG: hypothetical protein KDC38_11675 [Planctomycetes bacterium]|nr:hypothetical protein [Planctomycetota bacterium]
MSSRRRHWSPLLLAVLASWGAVLTCGERVLGADVAPTGPRFEIEQTIWGFGTSLVAGLQPVSVLVRNVGDTPYRGPVSFGPYDLISLSHLDEWTPPIALDPGGSRWLQFGVDPTAAESYQLSFGPIQTIDLHSDDREDAVSKVRLAAEDEGAAARSRLGAFPERLFPRDAASLSPLREVVIDHAPELSSDQQRALKDWIWLGGSLQLRPDGSGAYPPLPGILADLSPGRGGASAMRIHAGRGSVVLGDFAVPAARGTPLPAPEVLRDLAAFTSVRHPWGWIALLSFIYIVTIGPVNWLLARRLRRYGIALAITVAAIALFSALFVWIGGRGRARLEGTYTLTHARPVEDGYVLTHFVHLFVRSGGRYELDFPSSPSVQIVPFRQGQARMSGAYTNGAGGRIRLELPLNSSRQVIAHSRQSLPSILANPGSSSDDDGRPPLAPRARADVLLAVAASGASRNWTSITFGPDGEWIEGVTQRWNTVDRPEVDDPRLASWIHRSIIERAVRSQSPGVGETRLLVLARAPQSIAVSSEVESREHLILYDYAFPYYPTPTGD